MTTAVAGVSGSLFVVTTGDGDVLVSVGQIRRLPTRDMVLTAEREVKSSKTTKRLTFRFAEPDVEREINLMYFVPGFRWIPTYRVELPDESNLTGARMTLQAELFNEIEDFENVPIDLVVGVPNVRFRNVVSPFSLEGTLRNALHEATPSLMGQQVISNALFTQRLREASQHYQGLPSGGSSSGAVDLSPELTVGSSQDLFVYHLPPMSLAKGHRAAVTVFRAEAPVREVYTWDLNLKRQDAESAPSGSGVASPLMLSENRVCTRSS